MKLKYYLRGIGVGILFTTLILTVANQPRSKNTLTDEAIINRAKELGMVEKPDELTGLLSPTIAPGQEDTSNQDSDKKPVSNGNTSNDSESDEKSEENQEAEDNLEEDTVTPSVTVEVTQTPAPTQEATLNTEQEDIFSVQKVRFEIESGMTSEGVAKLLMEKGVVEDAEGFNQYLKQNNYTRDIRVGDYEIEILSSYKDIADKIIFK